MTVEYPANTTVYLYQEKPPFYDCDPTGPARLRVSANFKKGKRNKTILIPRKVADNGRSTKAKIFPCSAINVCRKLFSINPPSTKAKTKGAKG